MSRPLRARRMPTAPATARGWCMTEIRWYASLPRMDGGGAAAGPATRTTSISPRREVDGDGRTCDGSDRAPEEGARRPAAADRLGAQPVRPAGHEPRHGRADEEPARRG